MGHIFISHVEEDEAEAGAICDTLEAEGYETWDYKRNSKPGPSYLLQTGSAIDESAAVVVLISDASLGSHQVTKEIVRAHESNKPIIPLLLGVSHEHFQRRQPEWREAIGAAASLLVQRDRLSESAPRLLDGLRALGILPGPDAKARLKLAIVEAAVAYALYAASLVNWAIRMNKGGDSTECQRDTELRASRLHTALAACSADATVPTNFDTSQAILSFLTQSPVLATISDSLRRSYSREGENLFVFCTLIGGIASARDGGVAGSASALEAQARALGQSLGLPQEIIDGCIQEAGFGPLRRHFGKRAAGA